MINVIKLIEAMYDVLESHQLKSIDYEILNEEKNKAIRDIEESMVRLSEYEGLRQEFRELIHSLEYRLVTGGK